MSMAPLTPVDGDPVAVPADSQETAVALMAPRRGVRSPIVRFAVSAIAKLLLSLIAISLVIFLASSVIPGDPARAILGKDATQSQIDAFRQEHSLDESVFTQYGKFVGNALHGDFGVSYAANQPVQDVIGDLRLDRRDPRRHPHRIGLG
jgi:hypothetical protein